MATAENTTIKRVIEVEEEGVILTLNAEEARALMTVTRLVGGSPSQSGRQQVAEIGRALAKAGIEQGNFFTVDTVKNTITASGPVQNTPVRNPYVPYTRNTDRVED